MANPPTPTAAPPLPTLAGRPPAERILRLMVYFDLFDHPLTRGELLALGFSPSEREGGAQALTDLTLEGRVQLRGEHCVFPDRPHVVALRQEKERCSALLWQKVPGSVRVLSTFPFVRGLSITGTLAKDAALPDSDIDFVVFTRTGRVWICRTTVALVRRLLREEQREWLCANVFLDEARLTYDQHTPYVAAEIGLSRPVYGAEVGARFVTENGWLREWLPGVEGPRPAPHPLPTQGEATGRRLTELLLGGRLGDGLEHLLPLVWQLFWTVKYRQLPAVDRGLRFRTHPHLSTNHFNNFQARVLARYRARLIELGLDAEAPR